MKKTLVVLVLVMVAPFGASAGLGLYTGASWGIGKMSSSANTIASRTMNNLGVHALPGYTFPAVDVLVGPMLEYRFVGQTTDVATVGNTNIKGTGYLLGFGGTFKSPKWPVYIAASFDFCGKYTLTKNNVAGQTVSYKKPIGFHVIAGYMVMPNISADVNFIIEQYKTNTVGGTDIDIASDKFKEWAVRLGGSYHL